MDDLRVVPDPLVFPPPPRGEWAPEQFMAVTPGQAIQVTIGGGHNFTWKVPPGVTSIKVECFGGSGGRS